MKVYIDGKYVDKEDAKISVFDRGVLYGDGVFEGIRAYAGRVFKLEEHLDRLYDSAKAIMLNIPMEKEQMKQAIVDTVKANGLTDAYIRVLVTRGIGSLGLDPFECKNPQVVIIAATIALYPQEVYQKGIELVTVSTIRNHPAALNPRIKSLNYLNNILAKAEAIQAGALEGVMLNHEGHVSECTGDNIFILRRRTLSTPPKSAGILEGITRNVVIELARKESLEVMEETLTRHDLFTADECFVTGTAAEICPVIKIDGRVIGTGKPGPITIKLGKLFTEYTRNQ